jgi:hypothetical protein
VKVRTPNCPNCQQSILFNEPLVTARIETSSSPYVIIIESSDDKELLLPTGMEEGAPVRAYSPPIEMEEGSPIIDKYWEYASEIRESRRGSELPAGPRAESEQPMPCPQRSE